MPAWPRVMLIVESSRTYGRGCIVGIAAYLRTHGPWEVLHLERSLDEDVPAEATAWPCDGVIARIENPRMAAAIQALNVPVIDIRCRFPPERGVSIDTDHVTCARIAADHFLERGFRRFAFSGYGGIDFSNKRRDAFLDALADQPGGVAVFEGDPGKSDQSTIRREALGEIGDAGLVDWLLGLPKPIGVFACNDIRGRQVLAACAAAGLSVPSEVAVIGVDNDEVICELSNPPLTSIEPDTHRIGFEAASLLDGMIAARDTDIRRLYVPPKGIVCRRSTEGFAVEDPVVASVLAFIRDHACDNIQVTDVLDRVPVSRSTLERRFEELVGHSPRREIERVRMERVCRMLEETECALDEIAYVTGFKTTAHLAAAFKRVFGRTPGDHRRTRGAIQPSATM
jgi:LacI family transcriptional regulator